ncbi:UNKNOWN [Stylonychia lemnae]|uniref:Uncharacterized protein n=1 Tax=Stylonychia lemnae TaxID=5949 RepID=A0A078A3I0_STYLE|nr:UNKNOWN [Stylonychia lemnae]|eukprot:CDW76073.1 UNKNOWN [Stylonychia lemnae]
MIYLNSNEDQTQIVDQQNDYEDENYLEEACEKNNQQYNDFDSHISFSGESLSIQVRLDQPIHAQDPNQQQKLDKTDCQSLEKNDITRGININPFNYFFSDLNNCKNQQLGNNCQIQLEPAPEFSDQNHLIEEDDYDFLEKSDTSQLQISRKDSLKQSRKKGRPYKGKCANREGREDMVVEKRAIFRALKNIIQKDYKEFLSILEQQIQQLENEQFKEQVLETIESFKHCMSYDHIKNTKSKRFIKQNYSKILGNVCYRYSRLSKEKFFNNTSCSYIFKMAISHLRQYIDETFKKNISVHQELLQQFADVVEKSTF